jgi:4-methyl-5(b-hydroxyethyl)-thiazole monophosphate biosynthesis
MAALMDKFSDMVHPKPTALIPVVRRPVCAHASCWFSTHVLIPFYFQAEGSEEIEVVVMWDLLTRAGVRVTLAHVGHDHPHHLVRLVRGTTIQTDKSIHYCAEEDYDLIVVPGGPGSKELGASDVLVRILQRHIVARKPLGAICASPVEVLHRNSLVPGTTMTCFPPLQEQLGDLYSPEKVVVSGDGVVTSQAPGTAVPMALRLIELVRGKGVAVAVAHAIAFSK